MVGQIAIAASAAVDSDDGDLTACDAGVKRRMRIGAGHADSSERGSLTESAIRRADGGYSGFRRPPAEVENAMLRRGLGWGDKCWRTAAGASAGLTVTPRCFSGSPAPAEQAEMPNAYAHRAGRRNGAPNQRSAGNYSVRLSGAAISESVATCLAGSVSLVMHVLGRCTPEAVSRCLRRDDFALAATGRVAAGAAGDVGLFPRRAPLP